ncbi:MAG: hypothetical protein IJF92_02995 [Bacilli bacterium]|nr:hypothetical protein [Bacilli bacterium]
MKCNGKDYKEIEKRIEKARKCLLNNFEFVGPAGPQGPAGECSCSCQSVGQMIINGGMESIIDDRPTFY